MPDSKPAAKGKKGGAKDYKNLTGRQKAAIFLVSLGSDVSSEIMKHLREDEVETLTFEIARLETVDSDFKDQVLEEFQELMSAQNFITTGGIDYARELLEKWEARRQSTSSTALLQAFRFVRSTLSDARIRLTCSTSFSRNILRQSP